MLNMSYTLTRNIGTAIGIKFDFYCLCDILRIYKSKNNVKFLKLYQIGRKMIPHKYFMLKK